VQYLIGDATAPRVAGPKLIAHVCNDVGRYGKGFVVAVARRWPSARGRFRAWHGGREPQSGEYRLGAVQFLEVEPSLWVANMIGQHGLKPSGGVPPVRYDAIREAMQRVAAFASAQHATIHMPKIGCGLAGGTWDRMRPIVEEACRHAGVAAYVYDLPKKE
jgi:O-acetyl-ADP-ribose deacetylase (regulator of RNase III)